MSPKWKWVEAQGTRISGRRVAFPSPKKPAEGLAYGVDKDKAPSVYPFEEVCSEPKNILIDFKSLAPELSTTPVPSSQIPADPKNHEFYDPDNKGRCQRITGMGHFPEARPTRCWLTRQQHQILLIEEDDSDLDEDGHLLGNGRITDQEFDPKEFLHLRTDELWELLFEKYRLLDPMMMARRRDEISTLFNYMINARQITTKPIPDSLYKDFLGLQSMPRRKIADNPQA